jgi:hypothetical protein
MRRVLLVAVVLCFAPLYITAQQNSAVVGTLVDSTGAAVLGADVTVTNEGTGVVRKTVTGSSGEYSVPDLPVGVYRVQVSKDGFKVGSATGIKLDAQRPATIDFTMQLAAVSQGVTVASSTPLLNDREPSDPGTAARWPRLPSADIP